jgi:hypothetical protein
VFSPSQGKIQRAFQKPHYLKFLIFKKFCIFSDIV